MVRRCVFSSRLANGHSLGPGSRSLLWVSDGARASAMRDVPRLPANTKNCFRKTAHHLCPVAPGRASPSGTGDVVGQGGRGGTSGHTRVTLQGNTRWERQEGILSAGRWQAPGNPRKTNQPSHRSATTRTRERSFRGATPVFSRTHTQLETTGFTSHRSWKWVRLTGCDACERTSDKARECWRVVVGWLRPVSGQGSGCFQELSG